MFIDPFIGPRVRALIDELGRLSGRKFPEECLLLPDEAWAPQRRIDLFMLIHDKVSTVESLRELSTDLHAVETVLYRYSPFVQGCKEIVPGYERVSEKFRELLSMRWVVATDKHKKGLDLDPSRDWKTWAHGLVEVDQHLLDEFRGILNEAEALIRNTALPDFVDRFRLAYLTNDLMKAGIPTTGLSSPCPMPTSESDTAPCEYFKLHDEQFLRMTLAAGVTLTDMQKELAGKIICQHVRESEEQDRILRSLGNKLRRAGFNTSSMRFVRSESELGLHPERAVSIDTNREFLEIHTAAPIAPEQRPQIARIARESLAVVGVNVFLEEGFPNSPIQLVEQVLKRFHFAARSLANRGHGKASFVMVDEYDVQDLLRAILEAYFDDVIGEDPNPKFAGKSTRIDLALKKAKIFIEVKRPRKTQSEGDVGEELTTDIPHYRQRSDCQTLFCFVFDPDHRIAQPTIFKTDLESLGTAEMMVRVIVNQN